MLNTKFIAALLLGAAAASAPAFAAGDRDFNTAAGAVIGAAIGNAQAVLRIQDEFGSLDKFVWQLAGGRPRQNAWPSFRDIPARTAESDALSKALLARGCKFVGSTIMYAYMQAVGMVNDHLVTCYRHPEFNKRAKS